MNPKSLFSLDEHLERLSQSGDPLELLAEVVDFESFRALLTERLGYGERPQGGRPPFDPVLMFKVLILQTYHNLSDAKTEFYVRDRITWMRFLGFEFGDPMPDENTIRHFRNRLAETDSLDGLLESFEQQLRDKKYFPMGGQIVDATLVLAPKQRNSVEENAAVKEGKSAQEIWPDQPNKAAQKDVDARWTVEVGGKIRRRPDGSLLQQISQPKYGYKVHDSVDVKFGFIRKSEVTSASVHDGKLLKRIVDFNNTASGVWGDRAYPSKENEEWLAENGFTSRLHRKKKRGKPLPAASARANSKKSSVRAHVEHVFAHQKCRFGLFIRTIGLERAKAKIKLANLACNFDRLIFHERRCTLG